MSYLRVIPRDLFNEANLLKCYGQIYLHLERLNIKGVELVHEDDILPFDVRQYEDDGSLYIMNVKLVVHGGDCVLFRPLNSREPWPLYLQLGEEEIAVFNDDGSFTQEMLNFLEGDSNESVG